MPSGSPSTQRTRGRETRTFSVTLTLDEIKAVLKAIDYCAVASSRRYPLWTAGQKLDEAAARSHLAPVTFPPEQDPEGSGPFGF